MEMSGGLGMGTRERECPQPGETTQGISMCVALLSHALVRFQGSREGEFMVIYHVSFRVMGSR